MQTLTFKIEEQAFHCLAESNAIASFDVQSVPQIYPVTWHSQGSPAALINQYLAKNPKNLLLIDVNVWTLYAAELLIEPARIFKIAATESGKTLDSVMTVIDFLRQHEFTKGEQLVLVGGGITQDIGGFVAAIYKRGIPWHYLPTTLLSMSDSCIGGKVSVNYQDAKNQLALFSTPSSVEIHPAFLTSLDKEALSSGLGEILKMCITGGQYFIELFNRCVQHGGVANPADYQALIMAALLIKKAIIEVDEFERNQRRSLNYGHTLGHAIEVLSDYHIPHGQAIVVGMALVNELSHQNGLLSAPDLKMLNTLCYDLLDDKVMACLAAIRLDDLVVLIQKDKKTVGQVTSFVFVKAPGDTCFVEFARDSALLTAIDRAWCKILQRR